MPAVPGDIQQDLRPQHIRCDENPCTEDAPINMGFSGKVHNCVDGVVLEGGLDLCTFADVTTDKTVRVDRL